MFFKSGMVDDGLQPFLDGWCSLEMWGGGNHVKGKWELNAIEYYNRLQLFVEVANCIVEGRLRF